MSDIRTAASTNGAAAPPPPPKFTVTDEASAGKAIAALVLNDDLELPDPATRPEETQSDPREPPPPREPDDGATPPTVPDPEPDDSEGEPPEPPPAAIAPPTSWPADAKAEFAKLPPVLQKTISERESQREAFVTQRAQEAAEVRKAGEAMRAAAAQQSAAYLDGLNRVRLTVLPELHQLANTDWVRLRAENPEQYNHMIAMRDVLGQRLQMVDQAVNQEQQNLATQRAQSFLQRQEEERVQLHQKVPDMTDPVRRESIRTDLVNYLHSKGFSDDELSLAIDHRTLDVAYDALRWQQQQAARQAAEDKRNNPPPQIQRPGSPPATREAAPQARFRQAAQQLGRTNSVRDAGRLLALLN